MSKKQGSNSDKGNKQGNSNANKQNNIGENRKSIDQIRKGSEIPPKPPKK